MVNGLLQQLIVHDWIDQVYIGEHTRGFEALAAILGNYPPRRVAEICGVEARDVEAAAEIFGTSSAAVSTVLQGFYQSHQATAASVAVNNMHLVRGMLGRPGAGILQITVSRLHRTTVRPGPMVICLASATGRTNSTWASWPSCGMSIRSSFRTGPSRLTRCRSSAMSNKARSISCGSPAPTQRYAA